MKTFFYLLILVPALYSNYMAQDKIEYGLIVHGGAGSITRGSLTPEEENEYYIKLREALTIGYKILRQNGKSLDAVEAVVKFMENSLLFNAGKGAVFNNKGQNELDASIMDGSNLNAGAVAGVHHIKNPINLARLVMEKSRHVMLAGDGAEEFAMENGVDLVPESYFRSEKRWQQFMKLKEKEKDAGLINDTVKSIEYKFGTVGSVALDKSGNLAAATSTGGMMMKKYGRIGDSPIIGAGTYANNKTCAVSSTGHGEYFIRYAVAYDISARMEYKGSSLNEAADYVINIKLPETGGTGGVIAIDKDGNYAMPFNTDGMFRGVINEYGEYEIKFYRE